MLAGLQPQFLLMGSTCWRREHNGSWGRWAQRDHSLFIVGAQNILDKDVLR
jgi:hypothetical protein